MIFHCSNPRTLHTSCRARWACRFYTKQRVRRGVHLGCIERRLTCRRQPPDPEAARVQRAALQAGDLVIWGPESFGGVTYRSPWVSLAPSPLPRSCSPSTDTCRGPRDAPWRCAEDPPPACSRVHQPPLVATARDPRGTTCTKECHVIGCLE